MQAKQIPQSATEVEREAFMQGSTEVMGAELLDSAFPEVYPPTRDVNQDLLFSFLFKST
jgi:hypothetical protein